MKRCNTIKKWWPEKNINVFIKILVFMINPFLGFLCSLLRINTKSSYIVLFSFFLLFGISYTVDPHLQRTSVDYFLDGMFHRAEFENIANMSIDELSIYMLFGKEGGAIDFCDKLLKFIVSRYTQNYHYFFLVLSLIYSIFMLGALRFLTSNKGFVNNKSFIWVVYLFCSVGVFAINGVRFGIAVWIAVFALLEIHVENKKQYYFLLIITPFVHASFWIIIALVLFSNIFLKESFFFKDKILIIFFVSFLLGQFVLNILLKLAVYLPEPLSSWSMIYLNSDGSEDAQGRFYDIFNMLTRFHLLLMEYLLLKDYSKHQLLTNMSGLLNLIFVLIIFINVTIDISNLGGRFTLVLIPLLVYVWIKIYSNRKYVWILYLIPLVYIYDILYYNPQLYLKVLEMDFFYKSPIIIINKYL